ncbi:uncharacterized protein LOC125651078 [Ostrea edulis]|uniref:uncharacterized protein LOC125651078 n=1 Tax=Ostrea edulis TaxID=37623 RepID=UPI0024AF54E8|nr:uncharacterized protein LOC125651078 [Ostrea edulis]
MGVFQSCLSKNNKVGVSESEEIEAYKLVQRSVVTEELFEAKGGMAFNVTFGASENSKLPPTRIINGQKEEDFERWRGTQEKIQVYKQKRAQDNRDKERVQRQIETAQKEMERLEKYVNLKDEV